MSSKEKFHFFSLFGSRLNMADVLISKRASNLEGGAIWKKETQRLVN